MDLPPSVLGCEECLQNVIDRSILSLGILFLNPFRIVAKVNQPSIEFRDHDLSFALSAFRSDSQRLSSEEVRVACTYIWKSLSRRTARRSSRVAARNSMPKSRSSVRRRTCS